MVKTTRRRLLKVVGAVAGMTLAPTTGPTASVPRWRWRGTALGAKAEIVLVHPDEALARKLIRLAVDEIERLETIFSLYRSNSEISRLNRDGRLTSPSQDLVSLLALARHVSELTDGAFDATVQPLWQLYAGHFSGHDADPEGPPAAAIDAAKRLVDHTAVDIASQAIRFTHPDMAITLNGIAQGYITDRIADLLRAHGIGRTLIDLGETRAIGARPDGLPWRVAIEGGNRRGPIELDDRAMATSSPRGTVFDRAGRFHHLLDPNTGRPSKASRQLSVVAKNAALADALSTALATMPSARRVHYQTRVKDVLVYEIS